VSVARVLPTTNDLIDLHRVFNHIYGVLGQQNVSIAATKTATVSAGAALTNAIGGSSGSSLLSSYHPNLTGRDLVNQHPASAITFTPTPYTLGNDVQTVLGAVGDEVDRQQAFNVFNTDRDFTIYPNEQMNVFGIYTINNVVTIEGVLNQFAL
jgi:hypothetical protein